MTRKLNRALERYINAAQPLNPFKRIPEPVAARIMRELEQDIDPTAPNYDPNISREVLK